MKELSEYVQFESLKSLMEIASRILRRNDNASSPCIYFHLKIFYLK